MATEIIVTIPVKTPDADILHDRLELVLARCKLPRCQIALRPGKRFCSNAHRSEFHNKQMADVDARRFDQRCILFEN